MAKITKEDVQNAYLTDQRKRSRLLYEYYKEEYFIQGYTARFIAEKISQDLGVKITPAMIFLLFSRIIKKEKNTTPPKELPDNISFNNPQGKKENTTEKVPTKESEFVFRNADDLPKRDPIKAAMAHLTRKKE